MSDPIVVMLLAFYTGTIVINIVVALIQFAAQRTDVNRLIVIYWFAIITTAVLNLAMSYNLYIGLALASVGAFVSQYVLGNVFARVKGATVRAWPMIAAGVAANVVSLALLACGVSFEVATFLGITGATCPFLVHFLAVQRQKTEPYSTVQKMFLVTALAMSAHYLDWPFLRQHPSGFLIGTGIAIVLYHVLSILIPMMANEYALDRRNAALESEVALRVQQLGEAKHQLWEANKLASLGRLAGGVAHEIGTPLEIILLLNEKIARVAERNGAREEIIPGTRRVQGVVERISDLLEALRHLARETAVQRKEVDLVDVIEVALARVELKRADADAAIRLEVERASAARMVRADLDELATAVANLLDNAIDAVSGTPSRTIQLGVRDLPSGCYGMSVENPGSIEPAVVGRIMDPFFTTKHVGRGRGLGLSVSRSIVEGYAGRLALESHQAVTRFVVELPRTRVEVVPSQAGGAHAIDASARS